MTLPWPDPVMDTYRLAVAVACSRRTLYRSEGWEVHIHHPPRKTVAVQSQEPHD